MIETSAPKGVRMASPLTGTKVLMMFVAFFGIIISVNVFMAYKAVSTFPGLEVDNSYVASQTFDKDREAQVALGWTVTQEYDGEEVSVLIQDRSGNPPQIAHIQALIGRKTEASDDMIPEFQYRDGFYVAPATLARGAWLMHLEITAPDGTMFKQRINFVVAG